MLLLLLRLLAAGNLWTAPVRVHKGGGKTWYREDMAKTARGNKDPLSAGVKTLHCANEELLKTGKRREFPPSGEETPTMGVRERRRPWGVIRTSDTVLFIKPPQLRYSPILVFGCSPLCRPGTESGVTGKSRLRQRGKMGEE